MKQAEIQIGGVYVSKGNGLRKDRRVQVVAMMPAAGGHPAKVKLKDMDTGKITNPNVTSFQNSYAVESLPREVTDFKKAAQVIDFGPRAEMGQIKDGLAEVKAVLKMALGAVEKLERLLDGASRPWAGPPE